MYKYETHLHTYPVSKCAKATVKETLQFYKQKGYDGVFITNHFLDGYINIDPGVSYEEKINFYFSDYEEAKRIEKEIGIKVFLGVEMTYDGADFLIYGLGKDWYLNHSEIMEMKRSEELKFLMENGAFIVHAHPFRNPPFVDHIHLFPDCVHGVEVINGCRSDFENSMANTYAESYGFIKTAGSDNHTAGDMKHLAGMCSHSPIVDEADFINKLKNGEMEIFEEII